jgi:hypothetical protein
MKGERSISQHPARPRDGTFIRRAGHGRDLLRPPRRLSTRARSPGGVKPGRTGDPAAQIGRMRVAAMEGVAWIARRE